MRYPYLSAILARRDAALRSSPVAAGRRSAVLLAALSAAAIAWGSGGCDKASAAGASGSSPGPTSATTPGAGAAKTYSSEGVIKSFGPSRQYVNIAHEEIPGYMAAMVMAFEAGAAGQLDGIAVSDRVSFSFRSEEDGRQILTSIRKEP